MTKNEAPSSDEATDGLEMLNDMISSWSNDSMMIYVREEESFPLTSAQEYTIGVGQEFDTTPPIFIVSSFIRIGDTDYPLTVINDTRFSEIIQKSTSSIPDYLNYNNGYPIAKIKLYPKPAAGYALHLLSEKPLTEFSSLHQTVQLPPGWLRALKYNLAMELAPEFSQPVTEEVYAHAKDSKAKISRAIMKNRTMDWNAQPGGQRNIYTGWNY